MNKASKQGGATVEVSITTYDLGDETVQFTAIGGKVTVKESGKKAVPVALEAAVARMGEMTAAGWGVSHELVKRPTWAV